MKLRPPGHKRQDGDSADEEEEEEEVERDDNRTPSKKQKTKSGGMSKSKVKAKTKTAKTAKASTSKANNEASHSTALQRLAKKLGVTHTPGSKYQVKTSNKNPSVLDAQAKQPILYWAEVRLMTKEI